MIDSDGQLGSIVLDVGGFLGMGETEKSVRVENLMFVADGDDEGEYFVVYTGSRQLLEDSDDHESTMMQQSGYQSAIDSRDFDNEFAKSPTARVAMSEASIAELSVDDLEGTPIYGTGDSRLGEIGEMVLAEDGRIAHVIVDVGGFLGLGERHVAMKLGDIALIEDESGTMVGYVSMTKEQIEAMDEWKQDV